jgi:predicted transcriptional regulator
MLGKESPMLTVRLSEELETRLNEIVQKSGESKSAFTRDAIANFLTKWENDLLVQAQPDDTQLPIQ